MVDPASKFTELNCMRVGSPAANLPLPDLGRLEVMGYRVLSIRDLRVLKVMFTAIITAMAIYSTNIYTPH